MERDTTTLNVRDAYALLTTLVAPRPIGWIATPRDSEINSSAPADEHENSWRGGQGLNLAPFSYFQALCSDPPMITVSIADGRGGAEKDTLRLLRAAGRFVTHLVELHDLERMNLTSAELGPEESEAVAFGIDVVPFFGVGRVASARAALGCTVVDLHRYGRTTGVTLVVAEIKRIYVDDAIVGADGAVRGDLLNPVARLEGPHYAVEGRRVALARPTRPVGP